MPLNPKEICDNTPLFACSWVGAVRESTEAQLFWNEFFVIFGISHRRVASFDEPVKKLGNRMSSHR